MIIILGMAGAGKSTQCRHLEADGKFQWFSVGQHLREVETGTQKAEMAHGKAARALRAPHKHKAIVNRSPVFSVLPDGLGNP